LILDLFTRESGRVAVAAKGAKRPYSQLRAVLLPLQRISVSLSRPAKADGGEVQTLRSAEWGGGATLPVGAALFSGYYLN
ncbi:recombination protein O N-terminal domain-containing protein, partial [Acinetobacter baumannii]